MPKNESIFLKSLKDTMVLMVKYSGEMQQFIQINNIEIIHDWSHGVLAPYLQ